MAAGKIKQLRGGDLLGHQRCCCRQPRGRHHAGDHKSRDLLCLDELGYVQLDARGSELLFQILTEREEKASIALASNLPFSEWGTVIPDPRLVTAIVDRVTFNAHIFETGTDSYRLRRTRSRTGRKNADPETDRGTLRLDQDRRRRPQAALHRPRPQPGLVQDHRRHLQPASHHRPRRSNDIATHSAASASRPPTTPPNHSNDATRRPH